MKGSRLGASIVLAGVATTAPVWAEDGEAAPPVEVQAAPAVPATPASPIFGTHIEPSSAGSVPLQTIAIIVGSAGAVGLGLSAYFAIHAKSVDNGAETNGSCDNDACTPQGYQKRSDAVRAADFATGFLIAGSALTITGVTLYLLGAPHTPTAPSVTATPMARAGAPGISIAGRF